MSQRMVHFLGGPADGYVQLMDEEDRPFSISMSSDTDGYYGVEYDVVGQHAADLDLTEDDVVARWHQRSNAHDFMTGDTVIIRANGVRATAFAPTSRVDANCTAEGWTVAVGSKLIFVQAEEIRIARAEELDDGSHS